jgi:hypothetical protein
MCITVKAAEMSSTKILSLPIKEYGTHFLAYSNKVRNTSGKPNAMIFAIPGITKQEWFHDTTKYKDFLDEVIDKASLDEWMGADSFGSRGETLNDSLGAFEEFKLGMYTVGLASSFDGAEAFIASLGDDKRPEVSESLRAFFREKYAGWSFAVCCFNAGEAINAQPIAFEYAPFNPGFLYFPTMDAHDGNAPRLNKMVDTDHVMIFEHTGKMGEMYETKHIELDALVPEFLNKRIYRTAEMHGPAKNGDTYIKIADMSELNFFEDPQLLRASPVPYDAELSSPEALQSAIDDIIGKAD